MGATDHRWLAAEDEIELGQADTGTTQNRHSLVRPEGGPAIRGDLASFILVTHELGAHLLDVLANQPLRETAEREFDGAAHATIAPPATGGKMSSVAPSSIRLSRPSR